MYWSDVLILSALFKVLSWYNGELQFIFEASPPWFHCFKILFRLEKWQIFFVRSDMQKLVFLKKQTELTQTRNSYC